MPWPRILSAIIAIALALGVLLLGGWYFTVALAILVFLAQLEFFKLVRAKGIEPAAKTTIVVSQILLIITTLAPPLTNAFFPLAGSSICFYLLFQPKLATIADISTSILGLFYGGYLPSYWIRLRVGLTQETLWNRLDVNTLDPLWKPFRDWVDPNALTPALSVTLLAFGCIWAADIGAYVVGKGFGRTKLSKISPKKTVEGSVFGVVGSLLVAEAGAWYLSWPIWYVSGALLGISIGVVSLLGDLTESMMKRDAGVKDSGDLIPGHGGILDRTDSYVFTAPIVYYFYTIFLPWLSPLD